jgi:CheY-like chemotaxis protein
MAESPGVCIVDDDADIREAMRLVLEMSGYAVTEAADGAAALDVLRSAAPLPCCIILDLMMPGMNGWEFREQQRADPRIASVPVIILSGVHDLSAKAREIGAADQLQKPIELAQLLDAVGRQCAPARP